ncbi:MAG: hypothetical protein PHS41_10990, partial [Victivallaceae bacterium]|nr:hypothetical protein [Victivallaceae bacterium]
INGAPIVHNTHADLNLHAHYASSGGDTLSCGVYQTPYTTDKTKAFYPSKPFFSERPYFYNLNFQSMPGKPFIVYEHSFFRPYPYRAEWVPALTLMAAGLGWDALYLYSFGQRFAITDGNYSGQGFKRAALPIPTATNHVGYTAGFHSGGDEVLMATLALTSQAFLNGIAPNRETTVVTFGPGAWREMVYQRYAIGRKKLPDGLTLAGGEAEWHSMPDIYQRFMRNSIRSKLSVAFDADKNAPAMRVTGPFSPCAEDRAAVSASPDICWSPERNQVILDNSTSKIAVGILKDGVPFQDNVRLSKLSCDFAFFGVASRDGKPLRESAEVILTLVGKGENTDFLFDPAKIGNGALGHIQGVVSRGHGPVKMTRPAGSVELPGVTGTLRCYDFAGVCYREEPMSGTIHFTADESLFLAIVTRGANSR